MLSNTEIKNYAAKHPELTLTRQGSFFRFLIEKSASTAVPNKPDSESARRIAPVRAPEWRSVAKDRYRNTKLAAEHVSFFLSSIAEISPTRVLEVGTKLGRWGMLIGEQEASARHGGGSPSPLIDLYGIELSPDARGNRDHLYQAVTKGDFLAPLNDEVRYWDLVVVADPLNVWPSEVGNDLVGKAMNIADYVLIWNWCKAWPDRGCAASSEGSKQQSWLDAARANRVGVVDDCRYGAFLLSRTDPRDIQLALGIESLFEKVSRDNSKVGHESVSGPGSCLAQTQEIRRGLPYLLQSLDARSLVDAPCGDFNWMKHVVLGLDDYVGIDIVYDIVAENQKKFGGGCRQFIKADIIRDNLPRADVILCRDCLVLLSYDDVHRSIENFKRSGTTYLLTTTFTTLAANYDVVTGQWRPLNLRLPPFSFPNPLKIIVEGCTEAGGRYADKSLALWRLSDIA